ncbi:MAG: RNA-binding S4 domain-containing protein [Verrucomicrobia bacterium]|nr:RNA-binding S4 domain-containing protein [Verrucomicrobiota bacterium]
MSNAEATRCRIDKWLWAVRLFKTRALAIEACKAGHVKCDGRNLKPAHEIRAGEVYEIQRGSQALTFKVLGPLQQRVSATVAKEFAEDLTPPAPAQSDAASVLAMPPRRTKGAGRPTKRERRLLDSFAEPDF